MSSYIQETKTIELPKNIEESLIKMYEADWWRRFDTKNGDKDCEWAHLALPSDLEKACYVFVHPEKTRDFKKSTTLRLPTKGERYVVENHEYLPQIIFSSIQFIPREMIDKVTEDIRSLYFGLTRYKRVFGILAKDRRIDETRAVRVATSDYVLNFPIVYGEGQVADGLEVIFKDFLDKIKIKGSKNFYDFYKTVQEELKGETSLRATTMQDILKTKIDGKSGAEILADFFLSD